MKKIIRKCVDCGKDFEIEIDDNGIILTDCFYSSKLSKDHEYWECTKCCNQE